MTRALGPPHRAISTALVVAWSFALGARASGQQVAESHWSFDDARGGFCIWYLAEPALAAHLAGGAKLAPAGAGEGLPASLVRVIRDEPKFAQWIPATLCIGFYGTAQVDDKVVAKAKGSRSVTLMTSGIAVQAPHQAPDAHYLLVDMATDQRGLINAANNVSVNLGDIAITTHDRGVGSDRDLLINFSGTDIVWNGHAYGDSSVGTTRSMSFGYTGLRASSWSVVMVAAPASTRTLVGVLRVDGKSDLAKALKASPIRAAGAEDSGGRVTLVFQKSGRNTSQ